MRKRIKNSITSKIFVITLSLLMLISGITYTLIALTMPVSYRVELDNNLEAQVLRLIDQLQNTTFEDSVVLFDNFLVNSKAILYIRLPDNTVILPPSNFIMEENGEDNRITTFTEKDTVITEFQFDFDLSNAKEYSFSFADSNLEYTLLVLGEATTVNQVTATLVKILPVIIIAIVCISLFAAFFYSYYITKPIVSISTISKRMADMELDCKCDESRNDEIGILAKSLNGMADNLSRALKELKSANESLKRDIDKERELDRQRMMFFSAVSHELKTPITALQGQLEGMIQNYGAYKDRDKYLQKSLALTKSMEHIIQEIVMISRIDTSDFSLHRVRYDLAEQIREVMTEYIDLIEQKELKLEINFANIMTINADRVLIKKVISNLVSNAVRYSPAGETIYIELINKNGGVQFSIRNTGIQIEEEAMGHLFEAFYRVDRSRNRKTGGSGLGLYLVKRILDQHHAEYLIRNYDGGVNFIFTMES